MLLKGALAMQLVGQEMLAAGGSEKFKMFYGYRAWSRSENVIHVVCSSCNSSGK